jgi:Carboxypeptidase regulatory-like domain
MSAYRTRSFSPTLALWGALCGTFLLVPAASLAQTTGGTIKGQITDSSNSAIPGADVSINSGKAVSKKVGTDENGTYTAAGLAPGNYTVTVTKFGFANFTSKSISVAAGKIQSYDVHLELQASKQEVTVASDAVGSVSVDPSNNAGQLVLKGTDLDALPDDPDDLAADLQALAGPSAGPNGGQIYIDGFTGGNLPPKSSIREIRINSNPFSAEYDQLGFGRIEILTKPGTDRFRGSVNFNDSDGVFNSRNPYLGNSSSTALGSTGASTALNSNPSFQSKYYGGNLGGPMGKKASFFVDFNRREIDDNAIINATVLNSAFVPSVYSNAIPTPNRNTEASLRMDYQINKNNTLVARYSFQEARQNDAGIGTFSLPSTGYTTVSPESRLQLTETMVLGAKVVNETRFQFLNDRSTQDGPNGIPALVVSQAFTGGGAQVGRSWDTQRHYETQNYTSIAEGTHAIKFGVRVRTVSDDSESQSNFGGSFTFSGVSSAAVLGANNQPIVPGIDCSQSVNQGNAACQSITSLESYRRALVLPTLGFTPAQVCLYGGCPYQFSLTTGTPYLHVNETDAGLFLMDDWRFRPNLTLSAGVRYELQNHLGDHSDVAPRLGFAWSPGSGKTGRAKTVIRGGGGIFYSRFTEASILNAERFNGATQVSYVLTDPTFYPNVPTLSQLQQLVAAQGSSTTSHNTVTKYVVDPNLRTPTIFEGSIAVERQLPYNSTLSVNYLVNHTDHVFRSVNINTPLPNTYTLGTAGSGTYPYGAAAGGIYEYQSTGTYNQNQLITSLNSRVNSNISITAFYVFAHANSNTDGIGTFPSSQYTIGNDYGRASNDVRNRFTLLGSILTRYGIRVSPTIMAQTGQPFNITVGDDLNGDLLLTDRPAFAPASACGTGNQYIKCTKFGDFNLRPGPNDTIIPRNYGQGPGSFTANVRLSKTWGFGEQVTRPRGNGGGGGGGLGPGGMPPGMGGGPGGGGGGRGGGGGGPRGGGGGGGGGDTTNKRYNLTFSVEARNALNHVNPGQYTGNLLSPLFGESNSLGSGGFGPPGGQTNNRRITLSLRFTF